MFEAKNEKINDRQADKPAQNERPGTKLMQNDRHDEDRERIYGNIENASLEYQPRIMMP